MRYTYHGGVLYAVDQAPDDLARLIVDTMADTTGLRERGRQCAEYVREHSAPHAWRLITCPEFEPDIRT